MGWAIYAHLDAKISHCMYGDTPGVHFLQDRVPIYWAGMSQVEAQFRLFDIALANGAATVSST